MVLESNGYGVGVSKKSSMANLCGGSNASRIARGYHSSVAGGY